MCQHEKLRQILPERTEQLTLRLIAASGTEFFRNSLQHKNANIANFVVAAPLEMDKTNVVCNLKCNSLIPIGIFTIDQ